MKHMGAKPTRSLEPTTTRQALKTPRAAAIAGIAFAVLLGVSLALIRLALIGSANQRAAGAWVADPVHRTLLVFALNLIPYAGIAFLWFIGVVRDRMGQREDRFFATVFLGSGLLFVAMLFASAAVAGGTVAALTNPSGALPNGVWQINREVTHSLLTIYAMRMAAVFTISTATIALRIALMPRWIALLGYACAFVLLLSAGIVPWTELLFPLWVLVVSVYILAASLHMTGGDRGAEKRPPGPRQTKPLALR
jgi:hypothetical protein